MDLENLNPITNFLETYFKTDLTSVFGFLFLLTGVNFCILLFLFYRNKKYKNWQKIDLTHILTPILIISFVLGITNLAFSYIITFFLAELMHLLLIGIQSILFNLQKVSTNFAEFFYEWFKNGELVPLFSYISLLLILVTRKNDSFKKDFINWFKLAVDICVFMGLFLLTVDLFFLIVSVMNVFFGLSIIVVWVLSLVLTYKIFKKIKRKIESHIQNFLNFFISKS